MSTDDLIARHDDLGQSAMLLLALVAAVGLIAGARLALAGLLRLRQEISSRTTPTPVNAPVRREPSADQLAHMHRIQAVCDAYDYDAGWAR